MPREIHVAAWNLNHRTGRKAVPDKAVDTIAAMGIDILVLNEYVDGDHQNDFKIRLKDNDFHHIAVSVWGRGQNQVLMASRAEMADDDLLPYPGFTEAAATNWLHRRFPVLGIEVIGMRAPSYPRGRSQNTYWAQVESILGGAADRSLVLLGDVNCDPHSDDKAGSRILNRLRDQCFSLPKPAGDWSYCSIDGAKSSCIDHAITSPGLQVLTASYHHKHGDTVLAGPANLHPLTDHALLSVKVARRK